MCTQGTKLSSFEVLESHSCHSQTELIRQHLHQIFFIIFYETLDSRFSTSRELKSNRSSCCLFNSWEKICKLTFQCFHSPSSWASPLICVLSCLCLGVPYESVLVFTSHSYSVYTLLSTGCKHGMMFTINIGSLCAQSVTSGIQPLKIGDSGMLNLCHHVTAQVIRRSF